MLSVNDYGKYELIAKTPFGGLTICKDPPSISGKLVNIRPIHFISMNKYSGIEKLKSQQIKSFNNYPDSDTMLVFRWRLQVLGYSDDEILETLTNIVSLYLVSDDQYPELQKNNQHMQVIVESKLVDPPEPIGIITTYCWNKKSNLVHWSEHFDSKKGKNIDVGFREKLEGRALFIKYLVETFNMKTIIASYVGYYGYPKQALDILGFQHTGTIHNVISIGRKYDKKNKVLSSVYDYTFQENDICHPMRCIKKTLKKISI